MSKLSKTDRDVIINQIIDMWFSVKTIDLQKLDNIFDGFCDEQLYLEVCLGVLSNEELLSLFNEIKDLEYE